MIFLHLSHDSRPGSAWISLDPKLLYESTGGYLVDGLPAAAHIVGRAGLLCESSGGTKAWSRFVCVDLVWEGFPPPN